MGTIKNKIVGPWVRSREGSDIFLELQHSLMQLPNLPKRVVLAGFGSDSITLMADKVFT